MVRSVTFSAAIRGGTAYRNASRRCVLMKFRSLRNEYDKHRTAASCKRQRIVHHAQNAPYMLYLSGEGFPSLNGEQVLPWVGYAVPTQFSLRRSTPPCHKSDCNRSARSCDSFGAQFRLSCWDTFRVELDGISSCESQPRVFSMHSILAFQICSEDQTRS
jgi:hypothetical protein